MSLPNHKKRVYLPHIEYRLLSAIYALSVDGLIYCLYKKHFESIEEDFKAKDSYIWFIHTMNAYYDLAIGHWCRIFGSYSEPTHYYQLLETQALQQKLIDIGIGASEKDKLKEYLLKGSDLTPDNFDSYHQLTKEYRDRNLIHREHSPSEIKDGDLYFPKLEIAKKTLLSLILILIKLAKRFPEHQDEVNNYMFIYDDFDDQDKICEAIKKSFPNLS